MFILVRLILLKTEWGLIFVSKPEALVGTFQELGPALGLEHPSQCPSAACDKGRVMDGSLGIQSEPCSAVDVIFLDIFSLLAKLRILSEVISGGPINSTVFLLFCFNICFS